MNDAVRVVQYHPGGRRAITNTSMPVCAKCGLCAGIKETDIKGKVITNESNGRIPQNLLEENKCNLVGSQVSFPVEDSETRGPF